MKEEFFEGLNDLDKLKDRAGSGSEVSSPELTVLLEVSKALTSILDLSLLLRTLIDKVLAVTQSERGFLMLMDENGQLEYTVARDALNQDLSGEDFKISQSVVDMVLKKGKGIYSDDVTKDEKFHARSSILDLDLHTVMCVPLKIGPEASESSESFKPEIIGVIYVDSKAVTRSFKQADFSLLEAMASQAAVAIQNARLFTMATVDKKTGLFQHHYFQKRLEEECRRALRYQSSLALIMIDIDHFKKVNDVHGHQVGDKILHELGELIKNNVRTIDLPARYGGEEFVVILPQTEATMAFHVAERLRKIIVNNAFSDLKGPGHLTVSVGVASLHKDLIKSRTELIEAADQALYCSKKEGRNRTTVFKGNLKVKRESETPFDIRSLLVEDKELRTLYQISQVLNMIHDTTELLERIMDLAIETMGAERGFLVLKDHNSGELQVKVARNMARETIADVQEISQSVVKKVIDDGKPILARDARTEEGLRDKKSIILFNIISLLCVPLRSAEGILGAIYLDDRREIGRFDQPDLDFLIAFANLAAVALDSARYRDNLQEK